MLPAQLRRSIVEHSPDLYPCRGSSRRARHVREQVEGIATMRARLQAIAKTLGQNTPPKRPDVACVNCLPLATPKPVEECKRVVRGGTTADPPHSYCVSTGSGPPLEITGRSRPRVAAVSRIAFHVSSGTGIPSRRRRA